MTEAGVRRATAAFLAASLFWLAAILAGGTLAGLPRLDVRIVRPDLRGWLGGNVMPGVWMLANSHCPSGL